MEDPYASWKGKPKRKNTVEESYAACIENAELAGRDRRAAVENYDRLPPGDARLAQVKADIHRHTSDEPHWRQVAEFYRKQMGDVGVKVAKVIPMPVPDRRLPREAGDDTDEMSF